MDLSERETAEFQRRKKALRGEIFFARERWKALVVEHAFATRSAVGTAERSRFKKLYFIEPGQWWQEVQEEMERLRGKKENLNLKGSKMPRSIWLPTVIEGAKRITLKIYLARSVRKMPPKKAMESAAETGRKSDRHLVGGKIDSYTGRNYKLHVIRGKRVRLVPFTDWAVCICPKRKLPELKESRLPIELRNE